jgi:RHS repeat-associated protein
VRASTQRTTSTQTPVSADNYVWDLSDDLPLLLSDGTHTYLYGLGDAPYAQIDNASGVITYLHADANGTTRLTTSDTGQTTGTWTYDPYGNITAHTGDDTTPFLYDGQYRDADTGLYYLRARYYDPSTASFLSRDPLESTTGTPYAYTGGNLNRHRFDAAPFLAEDVDHAEAIPGGAA